MKSLSTLFPEKEFFSLRNDIHPFIKSHWEKLSVFKQFQQKNWKKAILDAFNHCALIESGKEMTDKRGYYKLKDEQKLTKRSQKSISVLHNYLDNKTYLLDVNTDFELSLTLKMEMKIQLKVLCDQLKDNQNILLKINSNNLSISNQMNQFHQSFSIDNTIELIVSHLNKFQELQQFLE